MAKDIRDLADEEVMQLVQSGNPRAFELLYDRHGGAAFSLAYRMVGNRGAAEDVVQEAFLSIWRSRLRYDQREGASGPGCWASSTTGRSTRCAGAWSTTAGARRWRESRSARRRPSALEVEVARREEARNIRDALDTLPEEQRKTIELAYFGGFSHSQIAELLNEPVGTIKGRMRLGLDKMRRQLSEGYAAGGFA